MATGVGNDELASLVVSLSADITRYQKDMAKVVGVTAKAAGDSEKIWNAANQNIAGGATRSMAKLGQSAGAVRAEVGNLAAQFQDIAVQLQGGASPFTIALQQGQQIGAVLQQAGAQGGSAFKILASAATGLLNPLNLIPIALIAVGGFALQAFSKMGAQAELTGKELQDLVTKVNQLADALANPDLKALATGMQVKIDTSEATTTLDKLIAQIKATATAAGTSVPTAIGALTDQFAGTKAEASIHSIEVAWRAFEAALAAGNVEEAGKQLALFKQGIVDVQAALGGLVPPGLQKILDLTKDLPSTTDEWAKSLAAAAKAQQQVNEGAAAYVKLQQAYDKALQSLKESASTLTDQEKQIKALTDKWTEAVNAARTYGQVLQANGELTKGLAAVSLNAAAAIGTQASATSDYAKIVDKLEGRGSPGTSSAIGKFQFIDSTWIGVLREMGLGLGKTNAELLAMRSDAELVDKAFEHFTESNAARLRDVGLAVNDTSKYMAHFLGVAGAIAVLKAAPDTLISQLIDPKHIAANKTLLGRPGETAGDLIKILDAKVARARGDVAPTGTATDIAGAKESLALSKEELAINEDLTKSTAERAASIAALRKEHELLDQAKKDGLDTDAATLAQIKQVVADTYNQALAVEQLKERRKEDAAAAREQRREQAKFAEEVAGIAKSAISGFISDLRAGKSAGEAFANMLDRILDGLINMALEALFTKNALGGIFGGIFGGGTAGAASQGGRVGSLGRRAGLSPFAFLGAPRMAAGGFVGVRPGEFPTILHRGEVVIPAAVVRQAGIGPHASDTAGGSRVHVGSISVATHLDGTGDVTADTARGRAFGRNIQALVQSEIVRQSQPGGLLRASGSLGRVGR